MVLNGTLVPIDRVAADRLFYPRKYQMHGMNLQVIAGFGVEAASAAGAEMPSAAGAASRTRRNGYAWRELPFAGPGSA